MANKVRITQVRSAIRKPGRQKRTMEALGLRRMHQTVEHTDNPAIRGMIERVKHLVVVDDAGDGAPKKSAPRKAVKPKAAAAATNVSDAKAVPKTEPNAAPSEKEEAAPKTADKTAAKKTTAKKAAAKKSAKKSSAKKSTAKKSSAKKSTAKRSSAKSTAKKASASKKSAAKKSTGKKS